MLVGNINCYVCERAEEMCYTYDAESIQAVELLVNMLNGAYDYTEYPQFDQYNLKLIIISHDIF
jgi:hypothetical protein